MFILFVNVVNCFDGMIYLASKLIKIICFDRMIYLASMFILFSNLPSNATNDIIFAKRMIFQKLKGEF